METEREYEEPHERRAINQCDGCRRGLPLKDGIHRGPDRYDMIGCTADRYKDDGREANTVGRPGL